MPFLDDQFLLRSEPARRLYDSFARQAPIIDFHSHLSPTDILEDRPFRSLTGAWLDEDHYKWRAMRGAGIPEEEITGQVDDRTRFRAWARTLPALAMSPLYVWTHLELCRVFGIQERLGPDTADRVFDRAAEQLTDLTPRTLLRSSGVRLLCTTDDPADPLEAHKRLAGEFPEVRVLPTFRPDRAMAIQDPRAFDAYVSLLADVSGTAIQSPASLLAALEARHTAFHEAGCRLSDHGLVDLPSVPFDGATIERIWQRVRAGRAPSPEEVSAFQSWLLHELALLDHARGWTSQYHLGAIRNLNTSLFRRLGPDAGADAIGLPLNGPSVAAFLNTLADLDRLPRTILYTMRPSDAPMLASIAGSFCGGTLPGRVQPGAAWWFCDTEAGVRRQLRVVAEIGVLGHWVGMVTDSRSLLSFTRHEYFRRILCDEVGRDVQMGLLPDDDGFLGPLLEAVCFRNAARLFD